MPKNWYFWTVVLEKTLESPLDNKEIKPVNPKGNQPRIFIGRTVAGGEAPVLWPPDAKSQLIGKEPDAGENWGQEENGVTEVKMAWWHPWLNGHEFEQTLGNKWRLGKPGVLQVMGLQRVRHDLVTEQQQQSLNIHRKKVMCILLAPRKPRKSSFYSWTYHHSNKISLL